MKHIITLLLVLLFASCTDNELKESTAVRNELLQIQDQMIALKKELAEKEEKLIEKDAEINSIKLQSRQGIDEEVARLNVLLLTTEVSHKRTVADLKSELEKWEVLAEKTIKQNKLLLDDIKLLEKMLNDSNSSE